MTVALRTILCFVVIIRLGSHVTIADDDVLPRPNIVLVMADDMGWGDVGYNGHPVLKTPHLDAMSRAGLRFDRFYAPTVCSPTRGSCLTGRHPYRYGITNANVGHLPSEEQTLAELLKPLGYATGHFGKWHLGTLTNEIQDGRRGGRDPAEFAPPWLHGFDVAFSTEQAVATWDPGINPIFNTHYWTGPGEFATTNLDGDDSRVIMDRAVPFIREAVKKEQPFLAVIWFHAPHEPVKAGPAYRAQYADRSPKEQEYYGCITAMDEQIGRLREELRQCGVAEKTIVWFCSDNGPEGKETAPGSTGPFRGRKRDLLEGGIRLPALLEWPEKVKTGRVVQTPAVTNDFLPTILDVVGASNHSTRPLDGISLRTLIENQPFERSQPIGFEYGHAAAWLDGHYKLFAELNESDADNDRSTLRSIHRTRLYDIVADPKEQTDLSTVKPELVKTMRVQLDAWREDCRRSSTGNDYQ
ncbi:sulfatase-like hydrolase/transferase [Schlesneria paludicola]|uniref:sulfatase-like hydrolase/transferase n=1 Tax=Schlesneria paludicola TaxID=360056 RepID=UPI00029A7328|nr:sulfatase-like hydrolase/transferase [Schlesneria paludicola]